jgi:hypothetical protein
MACVVVIFLAFAIVIGVPILVITLVTKSLIRKPSIANSQGEFNEQKWSFTSFPDNLSLVVEKYILDAKAMNMSNDEIKDRLLRNGWPEDAIDTALNSLRESGN